MADILLTTFWNAIYERNVFWLKISVKFVPRCPTENKSTLVQLTHWGRVTHICVGNLTIIGPDNGLSPGRRQAIIWTNAGILLIGPLGTDFSEISIEIITFSFKKIHLKMSSAKMAAICLGLNELMVRHRVGDNPLPKWVMTKTSVVIWSLLAKLLNLSVVRWQAITYIKTNDATWSQN